MPYHKFQSKSVEILLLSICSIFLLFSKSFAQPNRLVESVDVQGNRRLSDEEILRCIKTRSGENFNEKQAQNDLQALLKLGQFDAAHTRVASEEGMRGGVNIIFEVIELPLIIEVKFDGLRYTTKEELFTVLRDQKAEVTANSPYQSAKMNKTRQIIAEYLIKKCGLVNAKVEIWEEYLSATTLNIAFSIDEMENDDKEYYEEN